MRINRCVRDKVSQYRNLADVPDDKLLSKMKDDHFSQPLMEMNYQWRLYVGILRREAYKRGICKP